MGITMAEKTKEPKAPKEKVGRKLLGFERSAKIKFGDGFAKNKNPHREGTRLHQQFNLIESGMTLEAALNAGVFPQVLRYFQDKAEIKIVA